MLIDTHAHLTMEPLVGDESVLERARQAGVERIVNICTDAKSLHAGLALAKRHPKSHPWVFNTAATTPHDVQKEGDVFFSDVEKAAEFLVAIGETGLDYYYEHSPKKVQQEFLSRYLLLAKEKNLPLVFHCRDAFNDLFSITSEIYGNCAAVLHCFTGTQEEAKRGLDRGWYISFSGILTFKKSEELRHIASYVPLDKILVETDAPYLAPQSRRGKTNEPAFIRETLAVLAACKNLTSEEMEKITWANAEKLFPFSKAKTSV